MKKVLFLFLIIVCGCSKKSNIETIIEENSKYIIAINYPVTSIKELNDRISNYVLEIYNNFKSNYKDNYYLLIPELNIDYNYIDTDDYISVELDTYMITQYNTSSDTITFVYDKNNNEYVDTKNLKVDSIQENAYKIVKVNRILDPYKKSIAITFDDGPSQYTNSILDVFEDNNANATFFVLGNKVSIYKNTLKRMVLLNNEIGNHSYNHKWLSRLSNEEFLFQINTTQNLLKDLVGFEPTLLRPTYGAINKMVRNSSNLKIIMWDVDSNDWKTKNSKRIVKNVLNNVEDLDIILFHDIYERTAKTIKEIVPKLIAEGYQLVTVSELNEIKLIRSKIG